MDESRRPVDDLQAALHTFVPVWMRASVTRVVEQQRLDGVTAVELMDQRLPDAAAAALADLDGLLDTDVDTQRTSPLALVRSHVAELTSILAALGARPAQRDPVDVRVSPDDHFGLGPATWADIHPELAEPGLTWGAWKAAVILHRRRAEGLR